MPTQEYFIADGSIVYDTPVNPISRMVYTGTEWSRVFEKSLKYSTLEAAISAAKTLNAELPVRIFMLQTENGRVGVGEVKF